MENVFSACKLKIGHSIYVLPSEVPELLIKGAILVDIRTELETEIKAFGVENVIYLPYYDLDKEWESLPVNNPLIFADAVGLHSKEAAEKMYQKGYADMASLSGGITDWDKDGMPMKAGKYQPLNGPCPCMIRPHERK
ncbi:MAG: rhodanese-like domain-containing protein [Bacteroidetes bacterium]|nr:rhodanese-like domain-containing protein [Bacteroidota bacterium]